jgi:methionyl-tRNA formyltransferase
MVMRMEAGLDTGPVGLAERVTIGADETAQDLAERLAPLGADLVLRALDELERGSLAFASQPSEGVTYAEKIAKAEARIDWSRPARAVHDQIRGLSPFPGAWFQTSGPKGERVKVVRSTLAQGAAAPGTVLDGAPAVACGEGAVRLVELQRAGAKPMGAEAFLRGFPLPPGTRLA